MPFPQRDLGRRDREIMDTIWKIGSGSVREITERFSTKLAYTTVMTFVVRLHRKGMLQRQWKEKGYIYSAKISAREMADQRGSVHPLLLLRLNPASGCFAVLFCGSNASVQPRTAQSARSQR
jgi:predicted DNA-binding transcriptional regulator